MRAYRRKLRRRRYERTCTCEGSRTLTAPPPPKLIPKGWYGISLWVEMLLDKYFTYRPTERLLASWRLLGLDLAAGTVTDGLQRLENPTPADLRGDQAAESSRGFASRRRDTVADLRPPGRQGGIRLVVLADQEPGRGSRDTILDSDAGFRAGWPQGIAPLGRAYAPLFQGLRTTFSCVFEGFSRELSSHYIINTNCNALYSPIHYRKVANM